jgi:hypothetical protein
MCWWYFGGPGWAFWWIFPLIGIGFMIVMCFVMSRFFRARPRFCGPMPADEASDLRREIRELKEELARLKK